MSYQSSGSDSVTAPGETTPSGGYQLPTLAELSRSIGSEIVGLVENSAGDRQTVSGSVLYDRFARPARLHGAIALAIGMSLAEEHLPARLQELKEAGYVALVYKSHGASDADLRDAARSIGIALFRASDSVPWDQLTQIIDAAIIPRGECRRTLVNIRTGDLFELADAVASLSGGAVAIADPEQTLLAYSTLPEQPIDDTRRNSILQLHVPHSEQNDRDYRRVHASRDVVSVAPAEHSLTRSAVAIRAGSVLLGSLWLINGEDRNSADTGRVLLEAANVAALHILHRRINRDSDRARQIDLVKPLLFEPDRAEFAAVQLGISADPVRIAAMTAYGHARNAPDTLQSSLLLFDTVQTACAVWLPTAVCGLADNIVYIVLPQTSTSSKPFQRAAILRIAHHTRRLLSRPVLAGIGRATPIAKVDQSRLDSDAVLAVLLRDVEVGRVRIDSDDIVADQQSLGPRLRLRQIATELRAVGLLPGDHAAKIAEYDSRQNSFYEETIRTYLDCDANAIETAKRLGLHPNTVRYRLSRVEPLFGLRLDDPESRLLAWLELWANHN
jgi:hypothetical protein